MARSIFVASSFVISFVVAVASGACKSSSSSGDGAPCKGANMTSSCNDCVQMNCSDSFSQVESDCSDFLSCEQGCDCDDTGCLEGCSSKIQGSCATADQALVSCQDMHCASECKAGAQSSSSGMQTPNCMALAACCPTLATMAQPGCQTVAASNLDDDCKADLANYQCGSTSTSSSSSGAGGGNSCMQLASCCAQLPSQNQQSCESCAMSSCNQTQCAGALSGFKMAGLCM